MVAGCGVPSAGVAGGRGGCPRPIGGFADDEASTACARCRLSRRYGGRCRLCANGLARVFSASRDASPRHDGSRAERPGRVGPRRGAVGSVSKQIASFAALREALSPTASGAARIVGAAADT